jgi:CheY-like chemotaxis protein
VVPVAILGFTANERSSLSSTFRLGVNRTPGYRLVTVLTEAAVVLVDCDHAPSVELVLAEGLIERTVFVGDKAPAGATRWLARPFDMLGVLRELDALVAQTAQRRAKADSHFGTLPRVRTVIQDHRREADAARPAPTPTSAAAPAPASTPLPLGARTSSGHIDIEPIAPRAAAPAPHRLRALLVDDSTLALKFLQSLLERHGVITDTASTSQHALAKLAQRRADIVFVDVELGADSTHDGLALCQQIKRGAGSASGAVPWVALVSAHTKETDRARGLLAGCDAYITKPIAEAELERFVQSVQQAGSGRR